MRRPILERMLEEARRNPSLECCGLLAGRDDVISVIYVAQNTLASATAFEIAPAELFRLFREMRAAGLEHLGIYHSHPTGDTSPSRRDIAGSYYPDAAYFIVSPSPDVPRPIRAFTIANGVVVELAIEVVDEG